MADIPPQDINEARELLEVARSFGAKPSQVRAALALVVSARRPISKWVQEARPNYKLVAHLLKNKNPHSAHDLPRRIEKHAASMRKAIEAKDPDTAEILKKGRIILIKRPSLGQEEAKEEEQAQEEGQEGQEEEDEYSSDSCSEDEIKMEDEGQEEADSTEDEEYEYDSDSEDEIKMEEGSQEEEGQLMELDDEANLSI